MGDVSWKLTSSYFFFFVIFTVGIMKLCAILLKERNKIMDVRNYFGDVERSVRACRAIISGLERKRDRAIDKVLDEKNDVENIIESVDLIMDEFENDVVFFGCMIFEDTADNIKNDLKEWNII